MDYTAASGTLTWAAGDLSAKTITIPIVNRPDTMDDYDRGFQVTLSDPAGGAVLGPARTAIVGILGLSAGKAGTTKPADMEDAPPAMGR